MVIGFAEVDMSTFNICYVNTSLNRFAKPEMLLPRYLKKEKIIRNVSIEVGAGYFFQPILKPLLSTGPLVIVIVLLTRMYTSL